MTCVNKLFRKFASLCSSVRAKETPVVLSHFWSGSFAAKNRNGNPIGCWRSGIFSQRVTYARIFAIAVAECAIAPQGANTRWPIQKAPQPGRNQIDFAKAGEMVARRDA